MSNSISQGLIMCYIGAGKGKTTAAMGTCIRASGAGLRVHILQFVKAKKIDEQDRREVGEWPLSAEIDFLNALTLPPELGAITNEQVGLGFVGILGDSKAKALHQAAAQAGLKRAREVFQSNNYDLIFLDEIISAIEVGLLTEDEVVNLLHSKPSKLHVILTGHNKFEKILELSDLVTNMTMEKHPYYKGILAQRGIDY